jgi:cytochrome P450
VNCLAFATALNAIKSNQPECSSMTDAESTGKCPHLTFMDTEVLKCPVPIYRQLQEEAPIYFDSATGMYYVTRYADLRKIALDPRTFSNDTQQMQGRQTDATSEIEALFSEIGVTEVNTLVTNDPPTHRTYRSLVDMAFRDQRITAIEPRIRQIANDLIETFPDQPFDFVKAFAILLPMRMISEQLGIPPDMADTFKNWSDATIESTDPRLDRERQVEVAKIKTEMFKFLVERCDKLRITPNHTLISDVANARYEDRPLTRSEFCSIMVQLLVGGNETTTSALASCAYHLVTKPDIQAELRRNPESIRTFVEEVLRLDAPLAGLYRRTVRPVTVGDVDLPEGAILHLRWAAGNRDDRKFPNSDTIDLNRANAAQHLAFGAGIHYCLGNQLARAELYNGLKALLERSRNIRLADEADAVERLIHFNAQGPTKLRICFERA